MNIRYPADGNYFAKNICYLRKAKNWSQEKLAITIAERLGHSLSRAAIGSWEETRSTPPIRALFAIADTFGVTPKDLYYTDLKTIKSREQGF